MKHLEETLILFKPDALERGLVGEVLRRFEKAGLRVRDIRGVQLGVTQLELHYAELRAKNPRAYDRNARYLTGKHAIAAVLVGINAIPKVRLLVGPTEPATAPPGTVRGDYSSDTIAAADAEDRGLHNLVHAADSPEAARREIGIWFD
jgi:nucleoside-diphosphate kinase